MAANRTTERNCERCCYNRGEHTCESGKNKRRRILQVRHKVRVTTNIETPARNFLKEYAQHYGLAESKALTEIILKERERFHAEH